MIFLPTRKAIFTVIDGGIKSLVYRNHKYYKTKWHSMAREELNSQVFIIMEWHHQYTMPVYSTDMMTPQAAAPQEIPWESIKQILNSVPNKHLVGYNGRTTLNDYHQKSNCSDSSFSTNLAFADFRSGKGFLWRWKGSCWEKDGNGKTIFVNIWFHYIPDSPEQGN